MPWFQSYCLTSCWRELLMRLQFHVLIYEGVNWTCQWWCQSLAHLAFIRQSGRREPVLVSKVPVSLHFPAECEIYFPEKQMRLTHLIITDCPTRRPHMLEAVFQDSWPLLQTHSLVTVQACSYCRNTCGPFKAYALISVQYCWHLDFQDDIRPCCGDNCTSG